MSTTLNGWPITDSTYRFWVKGDSNGCAVRPELVPAFEWLAEQLSQVEPLVSLNGWRSQADNTYYHGHPRSDHMSGTAIDFNGAKHPYEANQKGAWTSGFSATQTKKIREILKYAGIFEWGADYPVGLRDAMHFGLKPGTTRTQVLNFIDRMEDDEMASKADQILAELKAISSKLTLVEARTTKYLDSKNSETLGLVRTIEARTTKYLDSKNSETLYNTRELLALSKDETPIQVRNDG